MANVVLDNLTKRYPDNVAVNELSLDIRDGEFLVLVGPSGCGKTTALRMIAGLEEISDGRLLIDGQVVNNRSPRDRDIAMVFQSYALYPHMTVFDNMGFGLQLRKRPKQEIAAAVTEAARTLDLEDYLHRKPGQLSGGQRQRVALGRAIVRDPAAFLMDEPLSNLDAKLRVQTRAEIARLHQRLKATIIYVTHDQVEAMTMGDRIAVMRHGVLQQVGTPRDLYEHPDNLFVAGFIGSPAMNFMDVERQANGDGMDLAGAGVQIRLSEAQSAAVTASGASQLTVGVRPEHLERSPGHDGVVLDAAVEVVEFLGHEELLHLRSGERDVVAVLDAGQGGAVGDEVSLHASASLLHLFNRETEEAIRV